MKVNVLCVGKMGEKYYRDACAEYAKRLRAFCGFTVTEVEESRVPDRASPAQIASAIESESERLWAKSNKDYINIAMCIEGKQMDSETLAHYFEKTAVGGNGCFSIFIGGSWGLSSQLKEKADLRLSMSPMTFPHQLARVMVCEQVYRAMNILGGGKYHK